ncbi:MAG: PaaI family thioesterase [Burkholderiaceae bacterium]|nr:PaaI family thioesterase [Burkholderiaceae bacterium]
MKAGKIIDPAQQGWSTHTDEGFIEHVGPIWERREDGEMRYGFVADPKHANLLGVVQGGMLMTFADRALGLRAWEAAEGTPCVTIQFEMQFLSSGRIGEFIELRPEVVRRTASLVFLRGVLTAGSRSVAAASGIWKRVRRAPAGGTPAHR